MDQTTTIEIPVEAATALALADPHRRQAVGRLVDRLIHPGNDDPLIALFERTAAEAHNAGLLPSEVEAEMAAHKTERHR